MRATLKKIITTGCFALIMAGMLSVDKSVSQDLKIGYVDPMVILNRMPELRAAQQRIQNYQDRREQELLTLQRTLQTEYADYQQSQGVISAQARTQREQRLTELQTELQELDQQVGQDIQQRQLQEMEPLLQNLQTGIEAVAAELDFDLIFNTQTSTGDVIIIYVAPDLRESNDITNAVMEHLDL